MFVELHLSSNCPSVNAQPQVFSKLKKFEVADFYSDS